MNQNNGAPGLPSEGAKTNIPRIFSGPDVFQKAERVTYNVPAGANQNNGAQGGQLHEEEHPKIGQDRATQGVEDLFQVIVHVPVHQKIIKDVKKKNIKNIFKNKQTNKQTSKTFKKITNTKYIKKT